MPDVLELFDSKTTLAYARERKPQSKLGPALFPFKKITELKFEYVKGANNLPVMAKIHAFNSEAEIASRDGADKVSGELALIKRKIKLDETDIIKLNSPRNNREEQQIIDKIYNDVDNMMDSVYARVEYMTLEALQTGKIVINENNMKATIDYQTPANHKVTLSGTNLWTDAACKILEDIYNGTDKIVQDTGITPTRALTTKNIVNIILKDVNIRKAIFGVNADRLATLADLNNLLSAQDLPIIATYDEQVRAQKEDGTYETLKYMQGDKFLILPEGELGETLFAPTAEEIRSKVANGDEYVFVQLYDSSQDPVGTWTKAASIAMPTFPMADAVYMLTPIQK